MRRLLAPAALVLGLLFPAAAEGRCTRYSNRADMGMAITHFRLFSTTVTTSWCFDGRRVTRLGRIRIYPSISTLGTLASWDFKGVVERDDEVLRWRAGYRVQRIVDWQRCTASCHHVYLELNSILHADGRARGWNRVRD